MNAPSSGSRKKPAVAINTLLTADEPRAVTVEQPEGSSDFLFTCDHASMRLPRALGTLGLSQTELSSHIAWDIGAGGVARMLAERLDATLVAQNYSRLVIDCNRQQAAADSIPVRGEWVEISGNERLDPSQIEARRAEIFTPYHDALSTILERRKADRKRTLLVAVHSFTPTYLNIPRPWSIGVMYGQDARMSSVLLKLLRRDERLKVGDNEPYPIAEDNDYTLPVHGQLRGLAHVGIEIRQDLIADEAAQKSWAGRLASLLKQAAEMLGK
ncbi:MAG TPA: N-formylglutamate amidohydrolase [Steroidobacteraceae bacterium]|jgi:predicted N-formylglutamate amidohydrolase